MQNLSGIEPVGGHLVVAVEKSETERRLAAMGMTMPAESQERDRLAMQRGRIVVTAEDARYGLTQAVGKYALFGRYQGTTVEGEDGETYRILYDEDVKGTMNG